MKNLVRGTVAAMIASVGVLGSAMTVCAAPADDVSLHTTQMTCEIAEDDETHEPTDEEIHEHSMDHAKQEANSVIDFFESIINFFS